MQVLRYIVAASRQPQQASSWWICNGNEQAVSHWAANRSNRRLNRMTLVRTWRVNVVVEKEGGIWEANGRESWLASIYHPLCRVHQISLASCHWFPMVVNLLQQQPTCRSPSFFIIYCYSYASSPLNGGLTNDSSNNNNNNENSGKQSYRHRLTLLAWIHTRARERQQQTMATTTTGKQEQFGKSIFLPAVALFENSGIAVSHV